MAEAAQGTQQEFWRPPSPSVEAEVLQVEPVPAMAEVCPKCSTEFLLGARFCHTCGVRRPVAVSSEERPDGIAAVHLWKGFANQVRSTWSQLPFDRIKTPDLGKLRAPGWLHYLHFHEIRTRIGLPTASLIAFVLGLVCVAGALLVGLLTAKTLVDWQAIQIYRIEWLLAATVAFVAGILLKKTDRGEQD
jgi:hypothetical protein